MTKDNAKDYLPLVQALAEGKTIQVLVADGEFGWADLDDVSFESPSKSYRIKPEPRRWWLVAYYKHTPWQVWTSKPEEMSNIEECVEVMEVIK